MLPSNAKTVGAIDVLIQFTEPSPMPKFAPPGWSLPGDPKNPLFIGAPPSFAKAGVRVEPLRRNIAPVVNSVAGPPMAQPSLLPGLSSPLK